MISTWLRVGGDTKRSKGFEGSPLEQGAPCDLVSLLAPTRRKLVGLALGRHKPRGLSYQGKAKCFSALEAARGDVHRYR